MPLILDGTKGETFPSWTTATRPATPNAGQTGYNTTLGALEAYNGSTWTMVGLNGPAFLAYLSGGNQSLTSGVETKVTLNTKLIDTNTCFNNTGSTTTLNGLSVPAYSFMPNVAGYYQVNFLMFGTGTNTIAISTIISRNTVAYVNTTVNYNSGQSGFNPQASTIVLLNGTTDYIDFRATVTATSPYVFSGQQYTQASAVLIRSA